jgi:hypothetical protein
MSMTDTLTDLFADEVNKLVKRAPAIDGIAIAEVLQRAATEMMKQCMSSDDTEREQMCFEILKEAKRELKLHAVAVHFAESDNGTEFDAIL